MRSHLDLNPNLNPVAWRPQGVTDSNFRQLMAAMEKLADLPAMTQEQLARHMGGATAAKKLYDWLHAPCPTMPT